MSNGDQSIRVGDRVECNEPGSWLHGLTATVYSLDVTSTDEIAGCGLQFRAGDIPSDPLHGCVSVLPTENLIVVRRSVEVGR